MANTPGVPDHAAPEARTEGISPKALWATVWAFVAPLLVTAADAAVGYVLDNPGVLDAMPPIVRTVVLAVLAALGAAVAAYRAAPGRVRVEGAARD